eukprot:TRINITY_DN1670_c0_g2_i9.p3 TRINITY_DN1670_c0_g2~~TRINITY_DN1670_c0_g2_i9.p3  ORF type:complete len:154 (-),score=42.74 TRINITY_DN1670_c0_g2_i9:1024-1485(-)
MNKKEATADHDLDQFLKELEDIEHGERELHKHLRQATQKIRESVNLDDLLRDIEEVRQDMIQNERELLSTPIYETSREFDVSQDKMLPMKKVEPAPKKEINVPEDPVEFLRELEVMNEVIQLFLLQPRSADKKYTDISKTSSWQMISETKSKL